MRRRLLLVVVAALALALLVPTGSFSVATIDRGVNVAVSPNEQAIVSIWDGGGATPEPPQFQGEDPVTNADDRVRVLVVQNNFEQSTVDVHVASDAGSPVVVDGVARSVAPGEVAPVRATVDCAGQEGRIFVPLTLHVVGVDGDVEAVIEYTASVVCAGEDADGANAASDAPASTAGNESVARDGERVAEPLDENEFPTARA